MREIKFRVWDGEIMGEVKYMEFPLNDSFPVMQYTGLEDKNGKEIYEGDILDDAEERPLVMKFNEKDAAFALEGSDECFLLHEIHWDGMEVIGNIHETPELLQQPTG